jgi:amidohydrolase
MIATLEAAVNSIRAQLIQDRRHLHANPELGFEEHATSAFVAERLRSLGLEVRTGVGGTGVVATIPGGHPGATVLLRADMDALPIQEENDVPYRSTNPGVMHACGHDGHTAILLATARI